MRRSSRQIPEKVRSADSSNTANKSDTFVRSVAVARFVQSPCCASPLWPFGRRFGPLVPALDCAIGRLNCFARDQLRVRRPSQAPTRLASNLGRRSSDLLAAFVRHFRLWLARMRPHLRTASAEWQAEWDFVCSDSGSGSGSGFVCGSASLDRSRAHVITQATQPTRSEPSPIATHIDASHATSISVFAKSPDQPEARSKPKPKPKLDTSNRAASYSMFGADQQVAQGVV